MRKFMIFKIFMTVFLLAEDSWSQVQQQSIIDASGKQLTLEYAKESIDAKELAVLVNTSDPQSVSVAKAYQIARQIPDTNMIYLNFPSGTANIDANLGKSIKAQADSLAPANIQAYAITWKYPFRVTHPTSTITLADGTTKSGVAHQSITSAFTFGVDVKYANYYPLYGCRATASVPYFNSSSVNPKKDLGIRPTMMIAGWTDLEALKVIEKGVQSDGSFPGGDGYFLRTTDVNRSVRYSNFLSTVNEWNQTNKLKMTYIDNSAGTGSNYLSNVNNILFYLTGLTSVPGLSTVQFVPGAVADHLTSYGGNLTAPGSGGQMSVLRFLEAGATGSYGTIQEPCNYTGKFPSASVLVDKYFLGNSLVEAYGKSVSMPGEGLFVGEPLAKPFGTKFYLNGSTPEIISTALIPGSTYNIEGKNVVDSSYTKITSLNVTSKGFHKVSLGNTSYQQFRIVKGTTTTTTTDGETTPTAPTKGKGRGRK